MVFFVCRVSLDVFPVLFYWCFHSAILDFIAFFGLYMSLLYFTWVSMGIQPRICSFFYLVLRPFYDRNILCNHRNPIRRSLLKTSEWELTKFSEILIWNCWWHQWPYLSLTNRNGCRVIENIDQHNHLSKRIRVHTKISLYSIEMASMGKLMEDD